MTGIVSSVDSRTQVVGASGDLRLANGNFFFMITATAAITVVFSRQGSTETYAAAQAGLQIGRVKPWDYAFIQAAPGTSVTFFYGYANLREDVTDFRQAIATISGITPISEQPSAAISDTPVVAMATATQVQLVPANLLRRRVTITNPSSNATSILIRSTLASANNLAEIQPGTFVEYKTTAAIFGIQVGVIQNAWIFEEN